MRVTWQAKGETHEGVVVGYVTGFERPEQPHRTLAIIQDGQRLVTEFIDALTIVDIGEKDGGEHAH